MRPNLKGLRKVLTTQGEVQLIDLADTVMDFPPFTHIPDQSVEMSDLTEKQRMDYYEDMMSDEMS